MNRLGKKSRRNLIGVHPDLVILVAQAIADKDCPDFMVFEGLRSRARQKVLYNTGASWTMDSKHLVQPDGYSHAVDLVPYLDGSITWKSMALFKSIGKAMKRAAKRNGVKLTWGANRKHGGDWKNVNDAAHFQLRNAEIVLRAV